MEFITYDKLNEYLNSLTHKKNKNPVIKKPDLAFSSCGFPVQHYTIGNGPKHFVLMAGTHGTEIIGIDFIIKLMTNISKGEGIYQNFDPTKITLDFIPCQNPEGFIIVTEALKPYVNDLNERELEKLSKEYYLNYRKADRLYLQINKLLKQATNDKTITCKFWDEYRMKDITKDDLLSFLTNNTIISDVQEVVDDFFNLLVELDIIDDIENPIIYGKGFHYRMFSDLSYQNLPETDERYIMLKAKVKQIMETDYFGYKFPKQSLIDWRANSNGVDLNKNNLDNLNFHNKEKEDHLLFGKLRFNNLMREVPGPQGSSSVSDSFTFEAENLGLFKLLSSLYKENKYLGCLSYHGTGGIIYYKPKNYLDIKDQKKADFLKMVDKQNTKVAYAYHLITDYKMLEYEKVAIGTGDMLRNIFPRFLIIELSKMGGNPLGPYGDKVNYNKVIIDNLIAFNEILNLITNQVKIN